jgi:hypothetical protein
MWSLSVHTVVWDVGDCRLRKKVREEHCLVCYSAVHSSKGAITDDPTAFFFYPDGSKSFCETVVLFYQIT